MNKADNQERDLINSWIDSPIKFIFDVWGLKPQLTKNDEFIKGKFITWQQYEILLCVEKAIKGDAPKRLSVRSGHGIGKDALLSWLIHWFLFTRVNSQIGCTAPTSSQMYDVLWKELKIWQDRLPKEIAELFEWSTTHYKIKEKPQTWWARARTAAKETPEAFAGLHGDSVMLIADEASGVDDEIFRVGEGSLTNKDTLVILMGNPTRTEGYFYSSFTDPNEKSQWQCLRFSSEDSPIVEKGFIQRIEIKYGRDSDEFRFRVLGEPPKVAGMLDGGWIPLFAEGELKFIKDEGGWGNQTRLGVDPSGEGSNFSVYVVRDGFRAKIAGKEQKSNPMLGAQRVVTISAHYAVLKESVTIDNFGEGANWSQEVALATGQRVQAINVGDSPDDRERFINKRSECYWRMREWIMRGGQLIGHLEDWKDLLTIYYKRNVKGKIQIMPKVDMFKHGWESPDVSDALSLCFSKNDSPLTGTPVRAVEEASQEELERVASIY